MAHMQIDYILRVAPFLHANSKGHGRVKGKGHQPSAGTALGLLRQTSRVNLKLEQVAVAAVEPKVGQN